MKKLLTILSSLGLAATSATTVVSCGTEKSISGRDFDVDANKQNIPDYSYTPVMSNNHKSLGAWANDPTQILWDPVSKQFYGWEMFRNDDLDKNGKHSREHAKTGWIEMTSPDMKTWTETTQRIEYGKQYKESGLYGNGNEPVTPDCWSGSVYYDKDGELDSKHKGAVYFFVSMPTVMLMDDGHPGSFTKAHEDLDSVNNNGPVKNDKLITSDKNPWQAQGIAWFRSDGFGKEINASGTLCTQMPYSQTSKSIQDWRDAYVFKNPVDNKLYMLIAAGNRLELWEIKDGAITNKDEDASRFKHYQDGRTPDGHDCAPKPTENEKIKFVQDFPNLKSTGVEVPNIIYLGNNKWYVSFSVQDSPFSKSDGKGSDYESAWWYIGTWDPNGTQEYPGETEQPTGLGKFSVLKSGKFEYGTEAYAQRVNDPYYDDLVSPDGAKPGNIVARTMPGNWGYDIDIWPWLGGAYITDQVYINPDNTLVIKPLQSIEDSSGKYVNGKSRSAIFKMKGSDLANPFVLNFDKGKFDFSLGQFNKNADKGKVHTENGNDFGDPADNDKDKQIIRWKNDVNTGISKDDKWTTQGGRTDNDDDIEIVWNNCHLTLYNKTKGWYAHFVLPLGIKLNSYTASSNVDGPVAWDDGTNLYPENPAHN